jgi:hypothetical protein
MSGVSVLLAVKTAVQAAREDRGFRGTFKRGTPSTPDNVVQAIYSS